MVGGSGYDFFISYTQADASWAEWIAWQLENEGHRVLVEAWDFVPGSNWVRFMDQGVDAARTVIVLSPDYLRSAYGRTEWQAAWAADPFGEARRLLLVRVRSCEYPSLLRQVVGIDLFDVDEAAARRRLSGSVRAATGGRRKPPTSPDFPGVGPIFPGSLPAVWNLPARLAGFTGRRTELERVHAGLRDGRLVITAVHGMGGVGKTRLAIEYAYWRAAEYDLAWWVPAENVALAADRLGQLGELLKSAGGESGVAAAHSALLRMRRWLLIFDNAEDPDALTPLIPAGAGHVLITSRNPAWGQVAARVPLDVMERRESAALLRAQVDWLSSADADRLAGVLGDLPLALVQVGAFLATGGMPVAALQDVLEARTEDVLVGDVPADYPVPLATSWRLSMHQLAADDPAAVQLLEIGAMMAPEPVPLSLFAAAAGRLPAPLARAAADPLSFRRTVARIGRLALGRISADSLSLHRLPRSMLRQSLSTSSFAERLGQARVLLGAADAGKPNDVSSWPGYSRLLPHLLAVEAAESDDPACREVLLAAQRYLYYSGQYQSALTLSGSTFQQWREHLGSDDDQTLWMARLVGDSTRALGRFGPASTVDTETLERRRRAFGEDHEGTLRAASGLAADLRGLGRRDEARRMDEATLARCRRVLGEDHELTLDVANNFAVDLRACGKPEDARMIHEGVLDRRRQLLGEDHDRTISSMFNLATDLRMLGDIPAAWQLDQHALRQSRRVLGDDHPITLYLALALGADLRLLGDAAAAATLEADAHRRLRGVFGDSYQSLEHLVMI
jgi:TIR domain/Tetratricopeptide repeat